MANPATSTTATRKSITGFVTKLVGDGATYGFINDEIFFQQTNVTDGPANTGDRVFAECEYSELLPIKWNATSIKIIGRASTGPSQLDSDPRRLARQGLLNQQPIPQAQQSQPAPPTNSYPQHRQQRQPQTHEALVTQPQVSAPMQQPPQQLPSQATPGIGMVDQTSLSQQPDFFSPFAQPPPQLQDLQPFQHDIPMGPPKLEYTSQLGAAFVQNQYMAAPLLPQQTNQQPMLPQHQPQAQTHQSTQQHQRQQQNYRDQKNSRDTNPKGRFNDKNDRNQNNRGRNRTDKKYDQPRFSERENSAGARSSRSSDSKDRSSGHNESKTTKRDESNSAANRQSPSTTRTVNSSSSDRGHSAKSTSRRYYEVPNVPKTTILTNLNGSNVRNRCSSSIHVPSDLKSVIVNEHLRLDLKNTPKPILFKIEQHTSAVVSNNTKPATGDELKTAETESIVNDTSTSVADETVNDDTASQSSSDNKLAEQITPPSSRSDSKLNHKYGVKVVLISLPELETIYKKIFGPDLDSYSNESRTRARLEETIALLCNKGTNGGHSLIGGKFDPVLDGFVEGEKNEFERYGKQPDLIATCRRVVLEQTSLDLGPCQGWTLVSTFLYNNKSDYFSPKSSVEYSFIYLPHIWSMMVNDLSDNSTDQNVDLSISVDQEDDSKSAQEDVSMSEITSGAVAEGPESEVPQSSDSPPEKESGVASGISNEAEGNITAASEPTIDPSIAEVSGSVNQSDQIESAREVLPAEPTQESTLTLSDISDLKVADLKSELDKRDIKYKPNAKKADLALALQMSLTQSEHPLKSEQVEVREQAKTDELVGYNEQGNELKQLEEGEVATDDDNTNDADNEEQPNVEAQPTESSACTNKRKSDDQKPEQDQEAKKVCKEAPKKSEKVDLIKRSFVVKTRSNLNQLSALSLHEAAQASRYDQFELSVVSAIIKESLTQHFSEYIFTTLVEDSRQKSKESCDSSSNSSHVSQDAANSDTNNNSSNTSASKTGTSVAATGANQALPEKSNLVKEHPVTRYINLAFAYFDSSHVGYIQPDDLSRLFNNTGLTISKRALSSLIGEAEKFNYRALPDFSNKLPPNHIYRFPDQFNRLPGPSASQSNVGSSGRMVEHQGVKYDVEKLIHQARDAEINQVNMVQRFNDAISRHDQQEAEIHVLEVSQMSLSKSIKALNGEISDLKREKSAAEKRVETLKKQIKDAIKTLSES